MLGANTKFRSDTQIPRTDRIILAPTSEHYVLTTPGARISYTLSLLSCCQNLNSIDDGLWLFPSAIRVFSFYGTSFAFRTGWDSWVFRMSKKSASNMGRLPYSTECCSWPIIESAQINFSVLGGFW